MTVATAVPADGLRGPFSRSATALSSRPPHVASIAAVLPERRIGTRTPQWREMYARVQVALDLSTRLNALPFTDLAARAALFGELLGRPVPPTVIVHPPFVSDYGLDTDLGDRVFIGHGCSFLDLGGITIGERTMISPRVTLITEGHPVEPADRLRLHHRGADRGRARACGSARRPPSCPGCRIGHDAVVGAGAVVAKDVPPLTVVTGTGHVFRSALPCPPESAEHSGH